MGKGRYTPFGEVLRRYMERAGLSQQEFAKRMSENGYPHGLTQQELSLLLTRPRRVYPEFFVHAPRVLDLNDEETAVMLWHYGPGSAGGNSRPPG